MNNKNSSIPVLPKGELVLRTIALPKDTNSEGDIFGGWLLSNMDLGGGIAAREVAKNRITTVAIDEMRFWHPVKVGDTVCCYAELLKIGTTSLKYNITAWSARYSRSKRICVTEAIFTYVSIDENARPVPVRPLGD